MIVSDYDGTFYINNKDTKNNVSKVLEFMKNNCFVIATGRSYFDYKRVKDCYEIPSNYIIFNQGANIVKDGNVIYNISLDNELKNKLVKDIDMDNIERSFGCSSLKSRLTLDHDNLSKIYICCKSEEIAKEMSSFYSNKYKNYVNIFLNHQEIEIVDITANKSNAIKYIADLEKIDINDIYTIGDGTNDIEMIKNYKGYTIKGASPELKNFALKEYDSVSSLIQDVIEI